MMVITDSVLRAIVRQTKGVRKFGLSAFSHPANYEGIKVWDLLEADPKFGLACDINCPQYASGRGFAYLFYRD